MTDFTASFVPKNSYGQYRVVIEVSVRGGRYVARFEGDPEDLQLLFGSVETRRVKHEAKEELASIGSLTVKWTGDGDTVYFTLKGRGMRPDEVLRELDAVSSLKRK